MVFLMEVCVVFPRVSPSYSIAYDCKATSGEVVRVTAEGEGIVWEIGPLQYDDIGRRWARVTFHQDMDAQRWGEGTARIEYVADQVFRDDFQK